MRLSEAIRLGSLLGPQQFGFLFGPNDGSCALGAACLALGIRQEQYEAIPRKLIQYFPDLKKRHLGVPLAAMILHMNDILQVRREDIADVLVKRGLDCESAVRIGHQAGEVLCY